MDSNRSVEGDRKPHAICVPLPLQSHIKAMLKFSKLLHQKGFYITFVNTEFNHQRFINSIGAAMAGSLDGLPDFRFETIPDSLPPSDPNANQNVPSLFDSVEKNMLSPFSKLLKNLNNPPVTCIVSDAFMPFTISAAEKLGIPVVMLFTISATRCKMHSTKRDKGLIPLKDWVPGTKDICLRNLPIPIPTKDPNDVKPEFPIEAVEKAATASGVVIHTFDALEREVLNALSQMFPRVYAIGPLQLLLNHSPNDPLKSIGYSLWKEEGECLQWLDSKPANSVIYVNFGSIAVMTEQQLLEFAWGLANSNFPFLLIIRPDLVIGRPSAIFPPEFLSETKERGVITAWCPQEEVLNHPAIGVFLTHCGWNSIIESLSAGVPLLCCPFFADQPANCWYACDEWSIGMKIDKNAPREEVEKLVRELMEGDNGKKIKNKVLEWKKLAEEATDPHGSSSRNLENLVDLLLSKG